jgi:hypothetical protein
LLAPGRAGSFAFVTRDGRFERSNRDRALVTLRGRAFHDVELLAKDEAALHEHLFLDKRDDEGVALLPRRRCRLYDRADRHALHDDVLASQDFIDDGVPLLDVRVDPHARALHRMALDADPLLHERNDEQLLVGLRHPTSSYDGMAGLLKAPPKNPYCLTSTSPW